MAFAVTAATAVTSMTTTRLVNSQAGTVVHRLRIRSPRKVEGGTNFKTSIVLTAKGAPLNAIVLHLYVPGQGHQIRPPKAWKVDSSTNTATVRITHMAAGMSRKLPLEWHAPAANTVLHYRITLKARGVSEAHKWKVAVELPVEPSFSFDSSITTGGQPRTASTDPNRYWRSCGQTVSAQPVLSFTDTLAAIDDFTASGTSSDAWQGLDLTAHPERVDEVAGIAIGAHQPAGALAAVIQGWRDTPNDGVFLNDAAALSNMVLHPEWAIALENKAATTNVFGSSGLSNQAIRLVNLGHAYAMTGAWATAKTYISKALALEPDDVQIQQEMAAVSYCTGDRAGAIKHFDKSLRPPGSPADDIVMPSGSTSRSRISASKLWDLSLATSPVVEVPSIPSSPADLVAESDPGGCATATATDCGYWGQEYWRLSQREQDLWSQESNLQSQLNAEDLEPVERQQINDILQRLNQFGDAQLVSDNTSLEQARANAWAPNKCDGEYSSYVFCSYAGTDADCGTHQIIFDKWHTRMVAWREAYGAYEADAWHVFSGLRANLYDPVAWQLAGVMIEDNLTAQYQGIVQDVWYSSNAMPSQDNNSNSCWTTPQDTAPQPFDVMGGAATQPCAEGDITSRVAVAIEGEIGLEGEGVAWSIKQQCSSTDYEADVGAAPFLTGFAKASYNTDGSGITYFLGVKADGSVAGSSASFSSSLYVTMNGQGRITDFGWDVGPEVTAGAGPVQITAYSDDVRLSFMSVFSDTPFTT